MLKKDTNDTRESAAIYVAEHLIEEEQNHIHGPKSIRSED
jgi:UDP-glucose 6-dehydrogenase